MAEPRPGQTTFLIIVSPLPGKYELEETKLAPGFLATGNTRTVGPAPRFRPRGGASLKDIGAGGSLRAQKAKKWPVEYTLPFANETGVPQSALSTFH